MILDYQDQICNRPVGSDGFELPPWLNPFLCDFNPELAALPESTELADHTAADEAWLAANPLPSLPEPFEPSDADLQEMAAWSAHLDRLEAMSREDDADFEARMRFGD
jgi:hypothetical protein